jgi:hypothetical protein
MDNSHYLWVNNIYRMHSQDYVALECAGEEFVPVSVQCPLDSFVQLSAIRAARLQAGHL